MSQVDSLPLRTPGQAKSDAPAYSERNYDDSTDSFRRIQAAADEAQREAQSFLARVNASDVSALRLYLSTGYLLNVVLIAGSAIMVFFNEMISMRGVLIGSVTSVVLVLSLVMIAHERGVVGSSVYNISDIAEKYCLLLATAPGRAALVVVLGLLVASCNWLGQLAFWASIVDAVCLTYVWQTHPWFVANVDNPLLFSIAARGGAPQTRQTSVRDTANDSREIAD